MGKGAVIMLAEPREVPVGVMDDNVNVGNGGDHEGQRIFAYVS